MPQHLECTNCGARLSSNDRAFPLCGLAVRDGRRQRLCPNCGTPAAQRAHTCLMCDTPLDGMPVQGMLRGVSWPWVIAVAVLAGMVGLGWNTWRTLPRSQPPPEAAPAAGAPTATATTYELITPTAAPPTGTPAISSTPTTPTPSPTPLIHVVKRGETLLAIASYYGTKLNKLMEANNLNEESARRLRVGQELIIPETGPVGGPLPAGNAPPPQIIHSVEAGDTLISIAVKYGADLDNILAANPGINPDLIYVGQQIVVPLRPPTATPTITLTPTPTDTPAPPYRTPNLLYPVSGQVFEGPEAVILLSWTAVDILGKGQAYLVEVEVPGRPAPVQQITQSTSWRLPAELWPSGDKRTCLWRVTVVQQSEASAGESAGWTPLSSPAEVRAFEWR